MAYTFASASSRRLTATLASAVTYPLSVSVWFNSPAYTGSNQTLLSIANTSNNDRVQLTIGAGAAAQQVIQIVTTQGATQPGSFTASTFSWGTWNHAAGVMASSTSRLPYVNGTTDGTQNNTDCTPSGANVLAVGSRFSGSYGLFATASIANVGVWAAALTSDEIASLALGVTPAMVRPQSLIFHAPLVRELLDERGGRSITNTNGATVSVHPRVYA
jgi:hypothetical protein